MLPPSPLWLGSWSFRKPHGLVEYVQHKKALFCNTLRTQRVVRTLRRCEHWFCCGTGSRLLLHLAATSSHCQTAPCDDQVLSLKDLKTKKTAHATKCSPPQSSNSLLSKRHLLPPWEAFVMKPPRDPVFVMKHPWDPVFVMKHPWDPVFVTMGPCPLTFWKLLHSQPNKCMYSVASNKWLPANIDQQWTVQPVVPFKYAPHRSSSVCGGGRGEESKRWLFQTTKNNTIPIHGFLHKIKLRTIHFSQPLPSKTWHSQQLFSVCVFGQDSWCVHSGCM